jgi:hypothetical protein
VNLSQRSPTKRDGTRGAHRSPTGRCAVADGPAKPCCSLVPHCVTAKDSPSSPANCAAQRQTAPSINLGKNSRGPGKSQAMQPHTLNISCSEQPRPRRFSVNAAQPNNGLGALTFWVAGSTTRATTSVSVSSGRTCPKRLLIEARWGSKPLAFAGKLHPRRRLIR